MSEELKAILKSRKEIKIELTALGEQMSRNWDWLEDNHEKHVSYLSRKIDDLQQTLADETVIRESIEKELSACKAETQQGSVGLSDAPTEPLASQAPKPQIAIIIGHDSLVQGAYSRLLGLSEWQFYENMRVLNNWHLNADNSFDDYDLHIFHRDRRGIISAHEKLVKSGVKFDLVMEFHFNAFDGAAHGSEIIVDESYKENGLKFFATELNDRWCAAMLLRHRGVKFRKEGEAGHFNVSNYKDAPYFLVEPFFGDNEGDVMLVKNVNILKFFVNMAVEIINAGVYTNG